MKECLNIVPRYNSIEDYNVYDENFDTSNLQEEELEEGQKEEGQEEEGILLKLGDIILITDPSNEILNNSIFLISMGS